MLDALKKWFNKLKDTLVKPLMRPLKDEINILLTKIIVLEKEDKARFTKLRANSQNKFTQWKLLTE